MALSSGLKLRMFTPPYPRADLGPSSRGGAGANPPPPAPLLRCRSPGLNFASKPTGEVFLMSVTCL